MKNKRSGKRIAALVLSAVAMLATSIVTAPATPAGAAASANPPDKVLFDFEEGRPWWVHSSKPTGNISKLLRNGRMIVRYNIPPGATGWTGSNVPDRDWSNHDALSFDFIGANSNKNIQIYLEEASGETFRRTIRDNVAGRRTVTIPFDQFTRAPYQRPGVPNDGLTLNSIAKLKLSVRPGAGRMVIDNVVLTSSEPNLTSYPVTEGTSRQTPFDEIGELGPQTAHGVRVYCPVSHLSYDDPVVHPGTPDAAHLHMFWGNTSTDANSTLGTLQAARKTTCEGGTNNLSAYWAPAFFNQAGEAQLPESIVTYYKSFGAEDFDRNSIRPIPNGLQLLAKKSIPNASGITALPKDLNNDNIDEGLELTVHFPTCLQVDSNGRPVLKSSNNVSHVAYPTNGAGNRNGCPSSHPYRIPQLIFKMRYNVHFDTDWSIASDQPHHAKGETLHADYIAAWDTSTMDKLVECNRLMRINCGFSKTETRRQLPERFFNAQGDRVYNNIGVLASDRTPFGNRLHKSRH